MLKVHTRNSGNVAVLCLQGRIVNGETTSLREAVISQTRVGTVVLDLGRVSTIDASPATSGIRRTEISESPERRIQPNISRV